MSEAAEQTRSVVIESVYPHAPEKLWRAPTESSLVAQWLMDNDFQPEVGRRFQFRAPAVPNWNGIIDCEVLVVEPMKQLSYSWGTLGLESVVLFTSTPADSGTQLRMEHSGFSADQQAAYKGAQYGWQRFLGALEQVVGGME